MGNPAAVIAAASVAVIFGIIQVSIPDAYVAATATEFEMILDCCWNSLRLVDSQLLIIVLQSGGKLTIGPKNNCYCCNW